MTAVTKIEFDNFVAKHCALSMINEPRRERDGEYSYECFDNSDGAEIAFITYKTGEAPVYSITEPGE